MLESKRPLCNVWRDPGQQQGFQRGRGRAGASRKLTELGWAREGWGELQKLKAEDLPCSRPWPDLGYLPLPRNPRQTVAQEADCTERSQQGPRCPQGRGRGACLTGTRVEGINTPEHFPRVRSSLCARRTAGRASGHPQNNPLRHILQYPPIYK